MYSRRLNRSVLILFCLALTTFALSSCGWLFGSSDAPAATPTPGEQRALVPTFTSTPVTAATPVPPAQDTPVAVVVVAPVTTTKVVTSTTAVTTTTAVTKTAVVTQPAASAPTPAPKKATLSITDDIVNVRSGPGTEYGLAGTANKDQQFDVIGKNQQGDWWQVCCVNGQQVWIFGALAKAENTDSVPVAAQIPPKPVVAQAPTAPPPTAPPAAPPTAVPQPEVKAAPAADPCAGIGGDGCKWKLRDGPKFAANGGGELKLQLLFIHSGNGDEAQGSYFVVMLKDGAKLPISDSIRSLARDKSQGNLGDYNYEYKISPSSIPGNNIAGNYVIYVLDGEGVRDSPDFSFTVPDGQGEVWIKFDQGG